MASPPRSGSRRLRIALPPRLNASIGSAAGPLMIRFSLAGCSALSSAFATGAGSPAGVSAPDCAPASPLEDADDPDAEDGEEDGEDCDAEESLASISSRFLAN